MLILLCTVVHAIEVRRGAQVQNWAVFINVALIVVFVAFACVQFKPHAVETYPEFSVSAFGVSLVWISFSYSGWNAAVYIGGEVRDPERNLPKSLLVGTTLVTVLYLALNAVFVFAAPLKDLTGQLEVGRIAARAIGGAALEEAVAAVIALVLISSASSLVMAGPRVCAKMADDGYLPAWLAASDGPPRIAIALQAALAMLMLWTSSFDALLTYIGFTLGISTAATVAALLVLRRREGTALRIPGFPFVPWLFLLGVLAMTAFTVVQKPMESLVGFVTILAGLVAWLFNRRAIDKINKY
jgi:APA family basic amino acid/polyamine antiporter